VIADHDMPRPAEGCEDLVHAREVAALDPGFVSLVDDIAHGDDKIQLAALEVLDACP
jgi:hypothetical protein